jgi:hypothetical protein
MSAPHNFPRYVFAVQGDGQHFPLQLLSSEHAWPARGSDARALHEHANYVQLESMEPPNIQAWLDAGWQVMGVTS